MNLCNILFVRLFVILLFNASVVFFFNFTFRFTMNFIRRHFKPGGWWWPQDGNEKSHQVNGSVIRGEFHEEAGYHIPLVLKGIPFKLYFQLNILTNVSFWPKLRTPPLTKQKSTDNKLGRSRWTVAQWLTLIQMFLISSEIILSDLILSHGLFSEVWVDTTWVTRGAWANSRNKLIGWF